MPLAAVGRDDVDHGVAAHQVQLVHRSWGPAPAELPVLATSLALSALASLGLAAVPAVLTGFVSMSLVGFLLMPVLPIVLELVSRRPGEAERTAAGLVWLSGDLGGLVVVLVVGLLVDSPALAFPTCGVLCLAVVPGIWLCDPSSDDRTSTRRPSGTSVNVATR